MPTLTRPTTRLPRTSTMEVDDADAERWARAVESRDPRFDGWVVIGVTSTGIYCRPSCPTPVRPKRENLTFHRTAAAAQRAGFRACKRCRPDAVPGSPAWDARGDVVGRAMHLITDGVVDREGVDGLARRLHLSPRHLGRLLTQEVGAGPLAIARANRARTARTLLESTTLSVSEVAFAAGFASIRQANDTIREVYATTPTALRAAARGGSGSAGGRRTSGAGIAPITVRLAVRQPFDLVGLLGWFAARVVRGVEVVEADEAGAPTAYARVLGLPGGPGTVVVRPAGQHVEATFRLTDLTDLAAAVARVRGILDLDADPALVREVASVDPVLSRVVDATPGVRVPGAAGPMEAALLTIVGQQVSVAAAARTCSTIAAGLGAPIGDLAVAPADHRDHHLLAQLARATPTPEAIAASSPDDLPMPGARARALIAVAAQLAEGTLSLDAGADRAEARARLLATPGIGPWTTDYLSLRALRDPDVLLDSDLIVRRRAQALGLPDDLQSWAAPFSPWRSYVTHHLWAADPEAIR